MRLVVYGAGGIGGVIAARLFQSGQDVVAIARGTHLETWRANGLRLQSPDEDTRLDVPVAGGLQDVGLSADDVVLLTVKSQDTVAALDDIAACCPEAALVCAQNGVSNEREALRRFERVYGICVMMPTSFTEPGVVQAYSAPVTGILDIGRYPAGGDETATATAAALAASTFSSRVDPNVMRQKYTKLLMNLGNAAQALCGETGLRPLTDRLRAEGEAVLRAAGIDHLSREEELARRGDLLQLRPIAGAERGGGSSWQSLARGLRTIETDHLNGEIVLIGRLHGVATPANALMQRLAREAARQGLPPGSMTVAEIEALLPGA